MPIELTPEQCQAMASATQTPIEVIDPQNQEAFVLLRRDEYEQLSEGASLPEKQPERPRPLGVSFPIPQNLADLPTPPEVARLVEERGCKIGFWGRKKKLAHYEAELKLEYYYGGCHLRCIPGEDGWIVVAIHRGDDAEYQRQVQALPARDRTRAAVLCPGRWGEEVTIL